MGRRRNNLHLYHFIGQQPQRPPGMSWRGLRAAQGDEVCLRISVEDRLLGWALLLFAVESCLQSLLHKAFPNACNDTGVHGESGGNLFIIPGDSLRIRFEKYVGMLDLLCSRCALAYQGIELLAFLLCQTYDVFLVHVDPLPHEIFSHQAQRQPV